MDRMAFELKMDADDEGHIEGTAWVFSKADRIGDIIKKGAFSGVSAPLPMLFGHDQNDPIGTWDSVQELDDGLKVKGRLLVDDLPRAREVRALVKAGAVRGISVGFRTKKYAPRRGGGRTISSVELLEASLVTIPMHPGAQVTSAKDAVRAMKLAAAIQRATANLTR